MLVAAGVTKRYGLRNEVTALTDTDVALAPGTKLGLTGPSGSGKSTLVRILAMLEPPDTGTVSIDGTPVTQWGISTPAAHRRRVQVVWQSPRATCNPRMRLHQLIAEPLRSHPRGSRPPAEHITQRAADLANEVGLSHQLLDRYPHEVSEGQLQRACLARALIVEPDYVLCDEPTSMLDVSTQAALLDVIAHRPTLGVLLVTHDHTLTQHWCHHTLNIGTVR